MLYPHTAVPIQEVPVSLLRYLRVANERSYALYRWVESLQETCNIPGIQNLSIQKRNLAGALVWAACDADAFVFCRRKHPETGHFTCESSPKLGIREAYACFPRTGHFLKILRSSRNRLPTMQYRSPSLECMAEWIKEWNPRVGSFTQQLLLSLSSPPKLLIDLPTDGWSELLASRPDPYAIEVCNFILSYISPEVAPPVYRHLTDRLEIFLGPNIRPEVQKKLPPKEGLATELFRSGVLTAMGTRRRVTPWGISSELYWRAALSEVPVIRRRTTIRSGDRFLRPYEQLWVLHGEVVE